MPDRPSPTLLYVSVAGTPTVALDRNVPGVYVVEVVAEAPGEHLASIALDVFHTQIPVKMVDDFIFTVHTEDGTELSESPGADHGDGRLRVFGTLLGTVERMPERPSPALQSRA